MDSADGWGIIALVAMSFYFGFYMGKKHTLHKISKRLGERLNKLHRIMDK